MPNVHQVKIIDDAIAAMMAELSETLQPLPEEEKRRMLEEQAPRMTELLRRHTAVLAE